MKTRNYNMNNLRFITSVLLMTLLVTTSDYAAAASIVTIAPVSNGVYSLKATDLPESAGMDLSVTYDANAFESPKVTPGVLAASAMMESNVSSSGVVRIVIIKAGVIKGTGELASLSFTKIAAPAWQPKVTSVNIFSDSGAQISTDSGTKAAAEAKAAADLKSAAEAKAADDAHVAAEAKVTADTKLATDMQAIADAKIKTASGTALGAVAYGGIIPAGSQLPQEQKSEPKKQENRDSDKPENRQPESTSPETVIQNAVNSGTPNKSNDKNVTELSSLRSFQGVMVRFRDYKGQRTLKGFTALFDENVVNNAGIVQTPAIAVSDGKSLMTVAVDLPKDSESPSFSLKGANQKAIRQISEKKWELVALPQKGKSDVRLSVILKGVSIEIPLVVVPPLNPTGGEMAALPSAALDALLAKKIKNKPVYDLNSDGKQDYLDDYILVAHWLLKQQRSSNGSAQKPAAGK